MNKILVYIIFPLLFAACADEQFNINSGSSSDVSDGSSFISLDITAGDFHKPVTKGVRSDTDFSEPYVMSFRLINNGSVTDTVLHEVVKTTLNGDKYYVSLTKSQEPHLLVFIANADSLVRHRLINHSIITKRYGEVMPLFTYGDPTDDGIFGLYGLKNPTTFVPFINERIPMWAKLNIDKVEPGSKIPAPVYLQRIVSKLYIDASEANKKDNFTLTGFTVLDVPSHAYIDNDGAANQYSPQLTVNYGTTSLGNNNIEGLILTNILNNTTESVTDDKPVYVFPFRKDDDRAGAYHILFSGHFGDNVVRYFKVKIGGPDSPAALNKQNTSYRINIQSIASNGYVSLAQALQYGPSTGVVVKVTLLDNSHDIVANGKFYMGLSNSEYLLCDGEEGSFIQTVTVLTYGKSPGSNIDMNKVSKSIQAFGGIEVIYPDFVPDKPVEIKAKFFKTTTQGRVVIKIGDLSKEVIINRVHTDAHPSAYIFPDLSYVDVNWEVNENDYQITGGGTENVRLQIPENTTPVKWVVREPGTLAETTSNSTNFAAEPVFTRKTGKGRVFDKSGLRGTTVIDIRQSVPVYLGWFGGEGNSVVQDAYTYPKRLIMESNEERSRDFFSLSTTEVKNNLTDKEHGVGNTKGMYELANNNAAIYPAAWNCWIKNDKNGDGIVTSDEAGSNPWYLPAQKQLQAMTLTQATPNGTYWCSTELPSSGSNATGFIVNMRTGRSDYFGKTWGHKVRCVRDL